LAEEFSLLVSDWLNSGAHSHDLPLSTSDSFYE